MTGAAETGSGSVASVFGVAVFLGFLLLASQVMIHLYATSTVTAVAFDTAGRAAASGGVCADEVPRSQAALGAWGSAAVVQCEASRDGSITVRIEGPSPAHALRLFHALPGLARIDRSASVRTEGTGA